MRRIAVVVLAASLPPLTLAIPASADAVVRNATAAAKTDFVATNAAPPIVSAIAPDRTAAGTLVTTDADGTSHPLAGASISLSVQNEIDRKTTDLGGTVTDAQGHFSKGFRFLAPAIVFVRYAGDAQHRSASYSREILTTKVTTLITVGAAPLPKVAGDTVTVSGLAQWVAGRDDLRPLADQPVRITNLVDHKVVTVRTGTDGTYRLSVKVYGYARWTASVGGASTVEDAPYYGATETTDPVTAAYPARIRSFTVTQDRMGNGVAAHPHGTVEIHAATGWTGHVGDVEIYFRAKGATAWKDMGRVSADARGKLGGFVDFPGKSGTWRADTLAGDAQPASATYNLTARADTRFSSFNAAPEPVRKGHTITVSGFLQQPSEKPITKQTVKIYFQPKGSKKWTYEAKATTNTKGHFTHGFKASKDGTWRAVFSGTSSYLAYTGPGDYVDVR